MDKDATDRRGKAIETKRAALLRIVAALFVYSGLDGGGEDFLPRRVVRRILRLLRPAESAVRRLIVAAAAGIEVEAPRLRPPRPLTAIEDMQARGLLVFHEVNLGLARMWRPEEPVDPQAPPPRLPAFRLIDPPYRFDWKACRRPFPKDGVVPADGDEEVAVAGLSRRIVTLKRALDDLPAQALRLARWQAHGDALRKARDAAPPAAAEGSATRRRSRPPPRREIPARYRQTSPMRPGWPPGYRKKPVHPVDDLLRECHALARAAWSPLAY